MSLREMRQTHKHVFTSPQVFLKSPWTIIKLKPKSGLKSLLIESEKGDEEWRKYLLDIR